MQSTRNREPRLHLIFTAPEARGSYACVRVHYTDSKLSKVVRLQSRRKDEIYSRVLLGCGDDAPLPLGEGDLLLLASGLRLLRADNAVFLLTGLRLRLTLRGLPPAPSRLFESGCGLLDRAGVLDLDRLMLILRFGDREGLLP